MQISTTGRRFCRTELGRSARSSDTPLQLPSGRRPESPVNSPLKKAQRTQSEQRNPRERRITERAKPPLSKGR